LTASSRSEAGDAPPPVRNLLEAAHEAASCRACDLWRDATQTVFGEGPRRARILILGEQPGDREDIEGHPFVGPAGRELDRAFAEAGIDRSTVYVTNAVKHFKFIQRGKRRIHKKPLAAEIAACRPWLELEVRLVKPEIVVALGATAAQAILGKGFRVTTEGGRVLPSALCDMALGTIHPSAILRAQDDKERKRLRRVLVSDLRTVARALAGAA
jgi:DNA polymerase